MTDRLSAFLAMTSYAVVSDLGPVFGVGSADMETSFVDAVDRWGNSMIEGIESRVLQIRTGDLTVDVTEAARARLIVTYAKKNESPEWLIKKEAS